MKCDSCHRSIASGVDAQKMICEYQQSDESIKIFGFMMSDGPLSAATGRLVRGWHHKHYHQIRKRTAKGDAVTGRVMPSIPTAYDVAAGHGLDELRAAVIDMQTLAREVGKPVGDPHVHEAYQARLRGGPYPHTHTMRLEPYQLIGHLHYAHGHVRRPSGYSKLPLQEQHDNLHAQAALDLTAQARAHDPGHVDPEDRDWRDQHVAEL